MNGYFTRHTWGLADVYAALAFFLFVFWIQTPKIFPASQFIELHLVEIADGYSGYPIPLTAENTIHMATERGFYEVDVISVDTGVRECFARRAVPYGDNDKVVFGVRRHIEKTLSWWAFSADRECVSWKPEPGEYYVKTRHCWQRYWWVRTACNDWLESNVFQVFANLLDTSRNYPCLICRGPGTNPRKLRRV